MKGVHDLIGEADVSIDAFDGKYYVSLVAFTMEKIRPGFLPAVGLISNFDEINLRTYIDNDNKKGVYFFNIEAGKTLSTFIANAISGLPYEKSNINRTESTYCSENLKRGFNLHTEFEIKNEFHHKTELDKWLTERYCLYLDIDKNSYRYDIHHKEWNLKNVEIKTLDLSYKIGGLNLTNKRPNLSHY